MFESVGEKGLSYFRGVLSAPQDSVDRVKKRAGLEQAKSHSASYVDRFGTVNVCFAEALTIARAFCAAEPSTVLVDIEATERKWSLEASRLEGEYLVRLLNEYRAAWALIRQWTGHDPAVAAREDHIQRLERLVLDAIYTLQKAGLDSEAHKLRRGLGKD